MLRALTLHQLRILVAVSEDGKFFGSWPKTAARSICDQSGHSDPRTSARRAFVRPVGKNAGADGRGAGLDGARALRVAPGGYF